FGGYVVDNYLAVAAALDLSHDYMYRLARNSLEASFLSEREKAALVDELDAYVAEWDLPSAD
ncbi:MAG: adenosine deaminase, partial [Acidimicrobiia bacterium]